VVYGLINLPAVLIVIAISILLIVGIQESARANAFIVVCKVAVVVTFIAVGWGFINRANYTPYIPTNTGPGHFGYSGILTAAGVIFFAYIGFDAVSTAAQEAKNPQRDMPIGIIGSLIICTVLYILYAYVLTGVVNYKDLNVAAPLAVAVDRILIRCSGNDEDRLASGSYFRHAGHAARAEPGVLFNVEGRVAPAALFQGSPQIPDSLSLEPDPHGFREPVCRFRADRRGRRDDLHRDAARLRDRLRGNYRYAPHAPGFAKTIPDTMGAGGTHFGDPREPRAHVRPWAEQLVAAGGLAGHRLGDLLQL